MSLFHISSHSPLRRLPLSFLSPRSPPPFSLSLSLSLHAAGARFRRR
ncbi:hypothetical protein RchiOBHm_Chr4g0413541 [Rosa chinensis]|uniref:Uncharacterized protein n=1 Tax=Rosa chinensis TaxID=74649 RepID=A0A2P6QW72_ROSCH|nr:hypothetical protein RchiOBHm_Chr4g0413541 [Rosa chinensis]